MEKSRKTWKTQGNFLENHCIQGKFLENHCIQGKLGGAFEAFVQLVDTITLFGS